MFFKATLITVKQVSTAYYIIVQRNTFLSITYKDLSMIETTRGVNLVLVSNCAVTQRDPTQAGMYEGEESWIAPPLELTLCLFVHENSGT